MEFCAAVHKSLSVPDARHQNKSLVPTSPPGKLLLRIIFCSSSPVLLLKRLFSVVLRTQPFQQATGLCSISTTPVVIVYYARGCGSPTVKRDRILFHCPGFLLLESFVKLLVLLYVRNIRDKGTSMSLICVILTYSTIDLASIPTNVISLDQPCRKIQTSRQESANSNVLRKTGLRRTFVTRLMTISYLSSLHLRLETTKYRIECQLLRTSRNHPILIWIYPRPYVGWGHILPIFRCHIGHIHQILSNCPQWKALRNMVTDRDNGVQMI